MESYDVAIDDLYRFALPRFSSPRTCISARRARRSWPARWRNRSPRREAARPGDEMSRKLRGTRRELREEDGSIIGAFGDRRRFLRLLAATAAPLAIPRRARAQAPLGPPPRTYTFKTAGGCAIEADVLSAGDSAGRPVVLRFHGGGLINGSRRGIPPHWRPCAGGRLRRRVGTTTGSPPRPSCRRSSRTSRTPTGGSAGPRGRAVRRRPRPDRRHRRSAGGYLTLMSGSCVEPAPRALSYYGYGDITAPWYSRPEPFYVKQPAVPKDEAYAAARRARRWPPRRPRPARPAADSTSTAASTASGPGKSPATTPTPRTPGSTPLPAPQRVEGATPPPS